MPRTAAPFILLSLFTCIPALAGEPVPPVLDLNAAHKGTVLIDQAILAKSEPPLAVQDFFAEARKAFQAHPMQTFAGLPGLRDAAAKHGLTHLGGPLLGALSHDGARVWVRTLQPAAVEVRVQTPAGERRFGPVKSSVENDLSAVVSVTGLSPATRYAYSVWVDGTALPLPADAALTTAPAPGATGRFKLAFGSDFHKTGVSHNALLEQMRRRGSSALLLLGDNIADDRDNRVGLHRSDYLLRDLSAGWRELAASTAVYAAWDDHDYFNNDLSGIPKNFTDADRTALRNVWMQNWNNPAYGLAEQNRGIFFRTRLGPCDLIMLDTRSQRTVKGDPDAFLGAEQMRWLEKELESCNAPFLLLTCGTMWSDNISAGKDSWGVWDRPGRERLLALLETRQLPVLLFSGDRHGARVITLPRPSGHTFWEFELGSLGAHPGPAAVGEPKETQPFGVTGKTLFGELEFDTAAPDPTVSVRILDPEGREHWQKAFKRSELMAPRR